MATTLRGAISAAVKKDGAAALRILREAGVSLNPNEEEALKAGNLAVFTDRQLADRFNSRVLGALGIDQAQFAPLAFGAGTRVTQN